MGLRADTWERPPCARFAAGLRQVLRRTGTIPHSNVTVIAHRSEYRRMFPFSPISSTRGKSLARARNTRDAPAAISRPARAPAMARMNTSVNSCAATEAREAPSENRTDNSCWRTEALDNNKAAVLLHAISKSRETDPN